MWKIAWDNFLFIFIKWSCHKGLLIKNCVINCLKINLKKNRLIFKNHYSQFHWNYHLLIQGHLGSLIIQEKICFMLIWFTHVLMLLYTFLNIPQTWALPDVNMCVCFCVCDCCFKVHTPWYKLSLSYTDWDLVNSQLLIWYFILFRLWFICVFVNILVASVILMTCLSCCINGLCTLYLLINCTYELLLLIIQTSWP